MSSVRALNNSSPLLATSRRLFGARRGSFVVAILAAANLTCHATAGEPAKLQATRSFSGILVDRAGFPVSRAMVAVAGENIWRGSHTDDQGRFRLSDLPPAAKTVLAYSQRATRMAVIPIRTDASPDTHYVLDRD